MYFIQEIRTFFRQNWSLVLALRIHLLEFLLRDVAQISEKLHQERSVIVLELAFKRISAPVSHCESLEVDLDWVLLVC